MTAQKQTNTKDRLLDAAKNLMLAKGFVATTVDEICEAANVTKGCFFHYFKSKEELGQATLDLFAAGGEQMFREAPFRKKRDPLQRVYGYVDFAIEISQTPMAKHGCLLGNFAQELSDTHEAIRRKCAFHFEQVTASLQQDMEEAKRLHAPRSRIDTHSLAEHFFAVLQGAFILAKSRKDASVVKDNLCHYKRYLKTIFGK